MGRLWALAFMGWEEIIFMWYGWNMGTRIMGQLWLEPEALRTFRVRESRTNPKKFGFGSSFGGIVFGRDSFGSGEVRSFGKSRKY